MLLKLSDGSIENIESDKNYTRGCETCDYGSCYVNEYIITLKNHKIEIEAKEMYEYAFSDQHMMEIILPNVDKIKQMEEKEFYKWIKEEFEKSEAEVNVNIYEL